MQRIMHTIFYLFQAIITVSLFVFCSPLHADVNPANPVYCHQNECLYCDGEGCFISSTNAEPVSEDNSTVSNIDELSTSQLNEMLSDLETEAPSPEINGKITEIHDKLQQKMNELKPKAKEASRKYAERLNKDAHTTYETLKAKNQQMLNSRNKEAATTKQTPLILTQTPIVMDNSVNTVSMNKSQLAKKPPVASKPKAKAESNKKLATRTTPKRQHVQKPPSLPKPMPEANPPVKKLTFFHYKPSIDFAQYALHQGNVRSGNLVEGFIPLGKFTFDRVLFIDLRYYNPNGIPREWSADLGFRQLPVGDFLWGIYGGFDRFRSATGRYFSQSNAGLEFWFHKIFLGANVYIPVGTKEYDNVNFFNAARLISTSIPYQYNIAYEDQHDERVLPGGDAELGWDITHGLTVYGGGYYFHHSGFSTVTGPKFRATYTFYRPKAHRLLWLFDRIRLEGLVTHDKPRGTSWLFGIRFTLGLAKHPNPTFGVIRHMADPIRRDLNGISEAFNTEDFLRDSSGQIVNVDIADGSEIDIRSAIEDDTAEVVGVVNTQTLSSSPTLDVGDHPLTITGGIYNFTEGNHTYGVQVGSNGTIKQHSGASTSLITMDGSNPVRIERLTLSVDDNANNAIAITSPTTALGQLNIDTVTANGAFNVTLDSGGQATVAFNNNQFTTQGANHPCVAFEADGDTLKVTSFKNNTIITNGTDSHGVVNQATNSGSINYKGNFTSNIIKTTTTTNGSGTFINQNAAGIYNYTTGSNSNISFDAAFSYNKITTNNSHYAYGVATHANNGEITYNNFIYNTVTTAGQDATGVLNYAQNSGNIAYTGNFRNNTLTTNTTAASSGNIGGNNASGIFSYATGSGASIEFKGDVASNSISTMSLESFGIGTASHGGGNITYKKAIHNNTLNTTKNSASGFYNDSFNGSNINFNGGILNNSVTTKGATKADGIDILAHGSADNAGIITFLTGISGNTFDVNSSTCSSGSSDSCGILLRATSSNGYGTINITMSGVSSLTQLAAKNSNGSGGSATATAKETTHLTINFNP